jgi:phosphate transport system permease protein
VEIWDTLFSAVALLFALVTLGLLLWIGQSLYVQSSITRHLVGWKILTGKVWDIHRQDIGAYPFVYGTFISSIVAIVLAVPVGVSAAIFLSEIAPRWISTPVSFLIELLAAIPSVIYGLWGVLVLCPWLNDHVYTWLNVNFGSIPFFADFGGYPSTMLAAGVILAIMIMPFITSVSREVIRSVPQPQREAALGLGATRWEMIRTVLLKSARPGIIGSIMLALGRAIGETMAVVMVIGNSTTISMSLLQPGYTMPALLANEFNEAWTSRMHISALLEIAFILFVMTLMVNAVARLLILLTSRNVSIGGQNAAEHPVMARIREVFGVFLRIAAMLALTIVVLLQIVGDLRNYGSGGLLRPVELVVYLVFGVRLITALLRKRRFWNVWRKLNNGIVQIILGLTAALATFILGIILYYVSVQGAHYLTPSLFTKNELDGGMSNGMVGTIVLMGIASVFGIPFGLVGGIYLAEFGAGKMGAVLRFSADVLNGIPSVVIGMFAYAAFVIPTGHFSALAGGIALGIMMIPTIMRTTEEMLRLIPNSLREGSLGLGATRMGTIWKVILPAARGGIMTGIMLAIARIIGETAPLLFTAFGNQMVSWKLNGQISSMTMLIYRFAMDSDLKLNGMAWSGALVLLLMVLVLSIMARVLTRSRYSMK